MLPIPARVAEDLGGALGWRKGRCMRAGRNLKSHVESSRMLLASWIPCASLTIPRRRRPGGITLMAKTTNGLITMPFVIIRARLAVILTRERGREVEYAAVGKVAGDRGVEAANWRGPDLQKAQARIGNLKAAPRCLLVTRPSAGVPCRRLSSPAGAGRAYDPTAPRRAPCARHRRQLGSRPGSKRPASRGPRNPHPGLDEPVPRGCGRRTAAGRRWIHVARCVPGSCTYISRYVARPLDCSSGGTAEAASGPPQSERPQ